MLLLLILFLSNHLVITLSADTVVSPEVNLDWTSQTFVIPPGPLPNDTGKQLNCIPVLRTLVNEIPKTINIVGKELPDGCRGDELTSVCRKFFS